MDYSFIITAFGIGIAVSIPLGPIGVLCIQRTMNKGFFSGFISGLGAAIADGFYASVAGFGISMIRDFLIDYQMPIRIGGSLFLAYIGYRIFMSNPAKEVRRIRNEGQNYYKDFATSVLVTISNPITVIAFGAIFAGFDLVETGAGFGKISALILLVFLGAIAWWLILIGIVSLFRNRIRLRNMLWINRITGMLIIIFAVYIVISTFVPAMDGFSQISSP